MFNLRNEYISLYEENKSLKFELSVLDSENTENKRMVDSLKSDIDVLKDTNLSWSIENQSLKAEVKRLNDLYVPDDYCSGNCFDCKFDIELDDNGNNPRECSNCLCNSGIKDHFVRKGENNEI